jgi:hypothetical protein
MLARTFDAADATAVEMHNVSWGADGAAGEAGGGGDGQEDEDAPVEMMCNLSRTAAAARRPQAPTEMYHRYHTGTGTVPQPYQVQVHD